MLAVVEGLGFDASQKAQADAITREAVMTSEIEGVSLDPDQVRSSVATRLGLPNARLPTPDRGVEGLVQVLFDASRGHMNSLDAERLFGWHAALFPTGYSDLKPITVGNWRQPYIPMKVVSGAIGKERVHFEAPPGQRVPDEMNKFFSWWDKSLGTMDSLLRAGVAHLYFVTIHPFEDGNGRIARALTDMAMAQDEKLEIRCYSLSAQIRQEQADYYRILETTQKGDLDITCWLAWFLDCFSRAMASSEKAIEKALMAQQFNNKIAGLGLNQRQHKVLKKLLEAEPEGFVGGLSNKNYRSFTKASSATATRDLAQLVKLGLLEQTGKARSVRYSLITPSA